MPCYRPLKGYRSSQPGPTGKHPIVFNPKGAEVDRPVLLPCGQCMGCRLNRSLQWALRCVHEAKQYDDNCFVTLTYNDAHLPANGSLIVEEHQRFVKRLKSYVRRKYGKDAADGIRFYMCGEYGERLGRPHFHFCFFNFDFADKKYKRVNALGDRIYTSEILDKVWGRADPGMCEIGSVTFKSAAYVARYITKKITGDDAVAYYGDKLPEYTAMSNGIGKGWFQKWSKDVFPSDFVVHEGRKHRVPRYYANLYEMSTVHPRQLSTSLTSIKGARKRGAVKHEDDNSDRRLKDRETVLNARVSRLKKEL